MTTNVAAVIDGKAIAEEVRAEVAQRVRRLQEQRGVTPGLAFSLSYALTPFLRYHRPRYDR